MQHIITRDAFNAWAAKHADTLRTNDYIQFDPEDDAFDEMSYYLSECNQSFMAMLNENGLSIDSERVTFDSDKIDAIAEVTAAVAKDYDDPDIHIDGLTHHDALIKLRPNSPWVVYELGGDDDVDYHGSYIDTVIMLLCLFSGIPYFDDPNAPHIPA